jgi:hypothetical protein
MVSFSLWLGVAFLLGVAGGLAASLWMKDPVKLVALPRDEPLTPPPLPPIETQVRSPFAPKPKHVSPNTAKILTTWREAQTPEPRTPTPNRPVPMPLPKRPPPPPPPQPLPPAARTKHRLPSIDWS